MADWEFPGLGFDPLPGNSQVARDLENDARIFGQRMTDQATELRKLAWRDGWQGQAADVFSQHLKTLPLDLERCGEAFTGLADALASYAGTFDVARRTTVADLEQRAVAARQKMQAADAALHTPVISAPGDCPPPPDHKPLDDAQDDLGAILREAHNFADKFNDSAEIQHLEHVISKVLIQYAPDEPGWNILKHWAGAVFEATGVDAIHSFINEHAEFFNHLAGFLSELSGFVGLIGLPAMFFPPLGTLVGAAVLGLTAASAGIKTSLYAGHARDANGKLLVSGWSLVHSYVDVALSAGAIAGTAGVERAKVLARGEKTTFGQQFAHQFSKEAMTEAWHAPKSVIADNIEQYGRKAGEKAILKGAVAKGILKGGVADFAEGAPGRELSWGGLVVGGAGSAVNSQDISNPFGWRSVQHLPHETLGFFHKEQDTPDLQVKLQPTLSSPRVTPTAIGPERPAPAPVMGTEKEH